MRQAPTKPQDIVTPDYELTIDGEDKSAAIGDRLMSISIVDNEGFEADTIQVQIDDSDGKVAFPKRGVTMSAKLGFKGEALIDKGDYIIDGISHSGAPDILTISGKSADFRKSLLEQKSKSYHDKTIGDIVEAIAGLHSLEAKVSDDLKSIKIQDLQQANESDANLLTRLAREYDAIATVKKGKLLFVTAGSGKSAEGKELPTITLIRREGDNHAYNINDRDQYTGVKARYIPNEKGKRKEVLSGDEERTYRIRKIYKTEDEAQRAADNQLKKLKRGAVTFTFSLAVGNPELIACCPVKTLGFKEEIDKEEFISKTVSLTLNARSGGLTSVVDCEVKEETANKGDD